MVFPVAKLAYMALRQISKPIAMSFKQRAKTSPFFRTYICMPPAQMYHIWETRLKMGLTGLGRPNEVKKLNEEMAVELGADILGEVIVFFFGAGCLYLEYYRQSRAEQNKEDYQNKSINDLTNTINVLSVHVDTQGAKLQELTEFIEKNVKKR